MLSKILIAMAVISGIVLVFILNSTTPANAGAFGILAVFVCAYLFILSVLTFLMYGLSRIIIFMVGMFSVRKPTEALSLRRAYYYSTVLSLVPVIIVSMQSIGGVGIYELGLILLFVCIGFVYVTKRTA